MQSLPRLGSLRGRGAIPPIRQGNPEGKREALLVRDVHDRVAQREERGRLEVAIDGGEARRGAEGVDPFAPCLRWGGPGSHRRYHHGIGSPMRRALVSGEERLRGPQRGRGEPKVRTPLPHDCAGVALGMELAAPCGARRSARNEKKMEASTWSSTIHEEVPARE